MNVTHLLIVGAGGAIGAIGRYMVVALTTNLLGNKFPWGTFVVNLIGSFLLGVAFVIVLEKLHGQAELRSLVMVGFLGAFTTFSTFSLEVFSLFHSGHVISAMAYILMSVILCVLATGLAVTLTRLLIQ
ncbi:fluoride efflux transporter CrcB [Hahella ganghwensis]|uniref:fluoride efflux transporter CrcB n=1 Tax=Hahella ganghwensis TaxID=286420 RepID=UPI000364E004|nr:fluoride efflux transporter CrcB [Hahella ganghwensis]